MGEIAEAMIGGLLCECCGEFIDGEEPGYPRYCSEECAKDRGALWNGDESQDCWLNDDEEFLDDDEEFLDAED